MISTFSIISVLLGFLITLFTLPYWIKRAREHHLVGLDVHKLDGREVAELGGLVVVFSIIIAILSNIAFKVFIYEVKANIIFLLAAGLSILIAMVIGLVDDILGWKIGLRQYQKVILSFLIPLPVMVINAGVSKISIPFFGIVDLGLIYPLLIIPLIIVFCSNSFNMIAGFNGLETGMGILTISTLGYLSWYADQTNAGFIAVCTLSALIAFFLFNKFPSKVFPGDTFTYSIGTIIAIIAIYGNIEKFALIILLLYYFEFLLKLRGKFQKESFGKVLPDGSLKNRYNKWYGLTHVSISLQKRLFGKASEEGTVILILLAQSLICISTVIYFFT